MQSITHFEIPANDDSKKFYKDAFGWEVQEMPEMNYTIVRTSEVDENYMPTNPAAVNGGMVTLEQNGGVNPVLVIDVVSIDDSLTKVREAGLEVVLDKMEVGDMGYYAKFKDHVGVIMGLWETIKKEE